MSKYIPNANTRQILVSVAVSDVANISFPFTSNQEIEKAARIISIQSFYGALVAKTDKGKTVVTKAIHDTSFLLIKNAGSTTVRHIPLKNLVLDADNNKTEPDVINLSNWDMQASSVEVAPGTAGLVADHQFFFLVTYEKVTDK